MKKLLLMRKLFLLANSLLLLLLLLFFVSCSPKLKEQVVNETFLTKEKVAETLTQKNSQDSLIEAKLKKEIEVETINYYVSSSALNLRTDPSTEGKIIHRLNQYDNLKLFEFKDNWASVEFDGDKGYVFAKYIKIGTAIVSTTTYRVGAACRDGTSSSATGRGACSRHGGVSYWKTKTKKSAIIK